MSMPGEPLKGVALIRIPESKLLSRILHGLTTEGTNKQKNLNQ